MDETNLVPDTPPTVRIATRGDLGDWRRLRAALWPEASPTEHERELVAMLDDPDAIWPQAGLLAFAGGAAVGLAEVSVRPVAEGCETRGVGYLEGWYVAPEHRRAGVGRALIRAAEAWARERGCSEMASDAEPDNAASRRAHAACGFEDVGLVRCFRKSLG